MLSAFISTPDVVVLPGFDGHCVQCTFNAALYEDLYFSRLGIAMPEALHGAVYKRKAEFLAGRYVAKHVLSQLPLSQHEVAIGQHRAPVWPDGVIGSISHHRGKAICAIRLGDCTQEGIGIDIEQRIQEEQVESIWPGIVNVAEWQRLAALPWDPAMRLTLVFSAKESLFKALYGWVGRYFDFMDAEVVAIDSGCLTFRLLSDLTPNLRAGSQFRVSYQITASEVLTFLHARHP
ncbi:4'-phosphopantetheinyl transferase superfamily protein [Photobacterium sp. MCCC 1A19761]|uniref:4'-phosphopantetheinyl transferase family protein n=1 Tax=Photobacterium sp. MCCC 1A19761 TaxID=3115000 RepID=UPI00307E70F1